MTFHIKYYLIIFFTLQFCFSFGQAVINLDQAFEIAKVNNSKLRTDATLVKYQQNLVNTAYKFSPTQLNAELGQFNSSYFDTGFGISQTFSLPKVYNSLKALNKQKVNIAEYSLKLGENELRQRLDFIFNEYNYLKAKEVLLRRQDSIYSAFVDKATLRLQQGETDVLERASAEQQKLQISRHLALNDKLKEYLLVELDWLLNDGAQYIPSFSDFDVLKYNIFYDSVSLLSHPSLLVAGQEIVVARYETQSERTALLPDLSVGYRNVSIRGTGADNVVYQGGDRFNSFQIGIGIPIFRKGIQASIRSAEIMEQVKVQEYESKKLDLSTKIKQKYILYNETMNQLSQYEQNSLPNAVLILSISEKQFGSGQINYLEYAMLVNQAIGIQNEYLELKHNLNMYIIEIHYLTTNY